MDYTTEVLNEYYYEIVPAAAEERFEYLISLITKCLFVLSPLSAPDEKETCLLEEVFKKGHDLLVLYNNQPASLANQLSIKLNNSGLLEFTLTRMNRHALQGPWQDIHRHLYKKG